MLSGLGVLFGVPGAPRCPLALAQAIGLGATLSRKYWGPGVFCNALWSAWSDLVSWAYRPPPDALPRYTAEAVAKVAGDVTSYFVDSYWRARAPPPGAAY